jgi:hypothetical protein
MVVKNGSLSKSSTVGSTNVPARSLKNGEFHALIKTSTWSRPLATVLTVCLIISKRACNLIVREKCGKRVKVMTYTKSKRDNFFRKE